MDKLFQELNDYVHNTSQLNRSKMYYSYEYIDTDLDISIDNLIINGGCSYNTFTTLIDFLLKHNCIYYIYRIIYKLSWQDSFELFNKIKYIITECPIQYKKKLFESLTNAYIENISDISRLDVMIIYYIYMKGELKLNYINSTFEGNIHSVPMIGGFKRQFKTDNIDMLLFRKQYIMFI